VREFNAARRFSHTLSETKPAREDYERALSLAVFVNLVFNLVFNIENGVHSYLGQDTPSIAEPNPEKCLKNVLAQLRQDPLGHTLVYGNTTIPRCR
jgi:hypothetical protein